MPGCRVPAANGWFAAAIVVGSLWAFSAATGQEASRAEDRVSEAETAAAPDAVPAKPHVPDGRVAALIERFTYVAIVAVLLLCGMGLPLPEEVPILTSAILSQAGHLRPWWALGACMFGVMLGDSIMFLLGQRWGSHVLEHRLSRKLLTAERQAKIGTYFERYGAWIIFAARFLPGIRAPLFLTAGSMRVSFWTSQFKSPFSLHIQTWLAMFCECDSKEKKYEFGYAASGNIYAIDFQRTLIYRLGSWFICMSLTWRITFREFRNHFNMVGCRPTAASQNVHQALLQELFYLFSHVLR